MAKLHSLITHKEIIQASRDNLYLAFLKILKSCSSMRKTLGVPSLVSPVRRNDSLNSFFILPSQAFYTSVS